MELIEIDEIKSKIYTIRNQQVMIDSDLAKLYGVETRVLNQAVKRNLSRFLIDFCFQLNNYEFENWKSQFVTSKYELEGHYLILITIYSSIRKVMTNQSILLKTTTRSQLIKTINTIRYHRVGL